MLIPVSEKRTLEQAVMLADMLDRQRERMQGWSVELVDEFPPLTRIPQRVILGSFSWAIPGMKLKLLQRANAVNIGAGYCTPADIARDYITLKYPNRRVRCTRSQYAECVAIRKQTPVYCKPCHLEYGYYVDVKSAYWSIVETVGWDVNYLPGRFLGVNSNNDDFPFPLMKMARNCLVSVGLPGPMRIWTGEKLVTQNKGSKFVNLILWRLAMDVLNGVARDAIDAGAVYAYTDGFIVPYDKLDAVSDAVSAWGLDVGVKHEGEVHVKAPAGYKFFGRYETKAYKRFRHEIDSSTVYKPDGEFLRWRFAKFAEAASIRLYAKQSALAPLPYPA